MCCGGKCPEITIQPDSGCADPSRSHPTAAQKEGLVSRTRKLLVGVIVVGLLGGMTGWATFSAFSSTTSNSGNEFAAGTVNISDNDAGAVMYNLANQKPGDTVTTCIKATYTGSLDSTVKMYASPVAAVGSYVDLTITPGTGNVTFPSCTGFTADSGGALYSGTLKAFADTYNNYDTGLVDNPGTTATKWVANDAVVYRFVLTLQDNNAANGVSSALSTGPHSFTWEARNQ
jgi:hypothetical protein